MTAAPHTPTTVRLTNEAFWAFCERPENADKQFELIEGIPSEMPQPKWLHQEVVRLVVRLLIRFLDHHPLGACYTDNTAYILAPEVILVPDISFIRTERLAAFVNLPDYPPFAPDLAVEVASPSNTPVDLTEKAALYLKHGTSSVWVIYPEKRAVRFYRPAADGGVYFYDLVGDAVLENDPVLPGFRTPITAFFSPTKTEESPS
ncbi:MAG TPA: Uma2 family endonuclease [Aggregatilineales bacterium]|nr:Uma2 family endonuclease [Anaerolineales bacterium]HRE47534.1 Uma2 family endonuclease [Aggregatilineales bacterium]